MFNNQLFSYIRIIQKKRDLPLTPNIISLLIGCANNFNLLVGDAL